MSKRASLVRGIVALAVLGALTGAMIASPVGAAAPVTKKKVKKIATRVANKVFNSKIGGASVANAANAANADKLDNLDSSAFQQTDDLLFAVVNSAGVNPVLVSGRGVTQLIGFVGTVVEFNRNVSNCAATASYGEGPDDTYAEVQYDTDPTRLIVWLEDDAGAFVTGAGTSFHLIVVCP